MLFYHGTPKWYRSVTFGLLSCPVVLAVNFGGPAPDALAGALGGPRRRLLWFPLWDIECKNNLNFHPSSGRSFRSNHLWAPSRGQAPEHQNRLRQVPPDPGKSISVATIILCQRPGFSVNILREIRGKYGNYCNIIPIRVYFHIGKVYIFQKFKISSFRKYKLFQTYLKVNFHHVQMISPGFPPHVYQKSWPLSLKVSPNW